MNPFDDALKGLAARLGSPADNPQRFREALEDSLVPLIRCALRHGTGAPSLVQWVRRHQPPAGSNPDRRPDPAQAARPMARMLCDALLRRSHGDPARETVAGR